MTERAVQAMISDNYLDSMIRAVRRSKTDAVAGEITDLILEARAGMIGAGVPAQKAENEEDPMVKGAIRSFVRWKFGLEAPGAESERRDYLVQVDNIRRRG